MELSPTPQRPISMQNSFAQAGQDIPKVVTQGMSPETDRMFRKWLKMQITQAYWNMIFKFLTIIFVIGSMIYSTKTLMPFLQEQLSAIGSQSGLGGFDNNGNNMIKMVDQLKK